MMARSASTWPDDVAAARHRAPLVGMLAMLCLCMGLLAACGRKEAAPPTPASTVVSPDSTPQPPSPDWTALERRRDSLLGSFTLQQRNLPIPSYYHVRWWGRYFVQANSLIAGLDTLGRFFFVHCTSQGSSYRKAGAADAPGLWQGHDTNTVLLSLRLDDSVHVLHIAPGLERSCWPQPHPDGKEGPIRPDLVISTGDWASHYFVVEGQPDWLRQLAEGSVQRMAFSRSSSGRKQLSWQQVGRQDREAIRDCAALAVALQDLAAR